MLPTACFTKHTWSRFPVKALAPGNTFACHMRLAAQCSKKRCRGSRASLLPCRPLPMPIPRRKPKRLPKDTDEEIDYLMFKAEAVEPHNTQSGFLFFDVSGVSQALIGSHILFTGIRNGAGQELFYFDIPLQK